MADCTLYVSSLISKFYGYDLTVKPQCCDNVTTFCQGDRIKTIFLPNYQLTGFIPTEIDRLNGLEGLYLHSNQLKGPIPPTLGNIPTLKFVNISSNRLSGPIPSELGNLKNLTNLFLQNNDLTGTVPASLGDLTQLAQLNVNNNFLEGTLGFVSKVPNSTYTFGQQRLLPATGISAALIMSLVGVAAFVVVGIFFLYKVRQIKKNSIGQPAFDQHWGVPQMLDDLESIHTTSTLGSLGEYEGTLEDIQQDQKDEHIFEPPPPNK